ncbi:PAS domain S-box protein [Microcoleus sp. FACHB-53]|nr:PAS domain S-box protein [Microcoleus sp. FACHB-53]
MGHKANVNILLVDDQPHNLLELEAILESLGQHLVKADSGEQALRYLRNQEFALILLDVQMPEMDGLETAKRIRDRPNGRDTPVLFMADSNSEQAGGSSGNIRQKSLRGKPSKPHPQSHPSETDVLKAYALGVVDYLFKPIVPEILRSKVTAWISLFQKTQVLKQRTAQLEAAMQDLQHEGAQRRQAELALQELNQQLELRVQQRTAELQQAHERQRVQRERLIAASIQRIRETLNLDLILATTVEEVRQFLQVDRVLVYRIGSDSTGSTIAESVVPGCLTILGHTFPAEVFPPEYHHLYCQGRVRAVVHPETDQVSPCLIGFLQQWGVKSKLVVPIVYQGELWGLLIAHHCSQPRQWQPLEMDLLQQLAIQLAIAIHQADLYQQVQLELAERKEAENALRQARDQLEIRVSERTAELTRINASLQAEIRERIAAEQALRTSEERFRVALKNSPITVFNQDIDLRFTWLYNSLLGFSFDQVVGKLDCELFGTEDGQRLTAIKRQVLTTGVGSREETSISINGEIRHYELTVEPLLGSKGDITGITCAAMDITEIFAREQQLRAIFESSLDAIAIIDDQGTYVEVNPAACQLFNLPLSQLLGQPIADLIAPDCDFKRVWRTVVVLGQGRGELRILRPDGTVRDVEYAAKTSFLPGRHLAVLRDITERKQAEEIRRALAAEQELRRVQLRFFSMVSHEFRTPLSTILGSAQLLKSYTQAWTEEKKLRNLGRIETAAKNMTQLLDDLLTINRAESGKLEFHPQPLELEKFCRSLVEDLQLNADPKHQISLTIQRQCPIACLDEKLTRCILTNLFSNAIKYSPQGGKIHLALTCSPKEAIFQIQDAGIGIPLEDQTHLFELFHRGQNIANIPGTGLGLSVVKQCLDLQGGQISIDSQVGVGTTVNLKIPLASIRCPLTQVR